MVLFVRELTPQEKTWLVEKRAGNHDDLVHRARIILLSSQGYRVPEIADMLASHPANLRKWIHRFNAQGCEGLVTVRSGGAKPRITPKQRSQIVSLARTQPRSLGLNFTSWTLHKLARQAVARRIVPRISHEAVRQILHDAGCDYRTGHDYGPEQTRGA